MSYRKWTILTRAASIAGLGTFALAIVLASPGGQVESFFNTWFYIGLMALACVVVAEIWWVSAHPESCPSVADVGYLGSG